MKTVDAYPAVILAPCKVLAAPLVFGKRLHVEALPHAAARVVTMAEAVADALGGSLATQILPDFAAARSLH